MALPTQPWTAVEAYAVRRLALAFAARPSRRTSQPSSASRATTTAIKFAIDVPVTNSPAAVSGKPKIACIQQRDLTLDLDGNLIAAAEIGVQSRGQHFRQHAYGSAAAVDPAHETGMNIARRERQDVVHELLMNFGE